MDPRVSNGGSTRSPAPFQIAGVTRRCPWKYDPDIVQRLIISAALATACSAGDMVSTGNPVITILSVAENPQNALSAAVTLHATNADSVRVMIRSQYGDLDSTPHHELEGAPLTIMVLGLRPRTSYSLTAEAADGEATAMRSLALAGWES